MSRRTGPKGKDAGVHLVKVHLVRLPSLTMRVDRMPPAREDRLEPHGCEGMPMDARPRLPTS
eukprot:2676386-Pyramimonas_sp.AAC.1